MPLFLSIATISSTLFISLQSFSVYSMYCSCLPLHAFVFPLWPSHPCLCISLSSLSSGTHKPKDPPWLALVQSESKKKKAPAPPPAGLATPPNTGSLSSLKGEGSRPSTPPPPSNPFDDDDDDENNEVEDEEGREGGAVPPTVAASHPWYSISRPADATSADTPPSEGSSSRSASPGSAKSKKRPAPRAPQPPAGNQGQSALHLTSSNCALVLTLPGWQDYSSLHCESVEA